MGERRRTGGRSGLVIASVRRAVEELIGEMPADRISIPLVAERAGVHATSVYRRWGDATALVADVVDYRLSPDRELPSTGDLLADTSTWALDLSRHLRSPTNTALLRAGAALAGSHDTDCTRQWREEATLIASRDGADPRLGRVLSDHVLAPIVYRVIFSSTPPTDEDVTALVREALSLADATSDA